MPLPEVSLRVHTENTYAAAVCVASRGRHLGMQKACMDAPKSVRLLPGATVAASSFTHSARHTSAAHTWLLFFDFVLVRDGEVCQRQDGTETCA